MHGNGVSSNAGRSNGRSFGRTNMPSRDRAPRRRGERSDSSFSQSMEENHNYHWRREEQDNDGNAEQSYHQSILNISNHPNRGGRRSVHARLGANKRGYPKSLNNRRGRRGIRSSYAGERNNRRYQYRNPHNQHVRNRCPENNAHQAECSRRPSHDYGDIIRSRSRASSRSRGFSHENRDTARPINRPSMCDSNERDVGENFNAEKSPIRHSNIGIENDAVIRSPSPDTHSPTQSSLIVENSLDSYHSTNAITESTDLPAMQNLQSPAVNIPIAIKYPTAGAIVDKATFNSNDSSPTSIGTPSCITSESSRTDQANSKFGQSDGSTADVSRKPSRKRSIDTHVATKINNHQSSASRAKHPDSDKGTAMMREPPLPMNASLNRAENRMNKKAKICLNINDTYGSKDNKQNIFTKNRIKQFKFILKIMQSRSNGWSLPQSDELDENNFCDAIHHFKKSDKGIYCLTEVKFFENSIKANKINYKNLFGDEFNIQRYFGSFLKFEDTCFSKQDSQLIIFMNREVDLVDFEKNGIKIAYKNDQYIFDMSISYEESKIYKKCLEFFDLPKLAELLSRKKNLHFNGEIIRKYHLALIDERVLFLSTEEQNGKGIQVAKFHPDFINYEETLSNAAKELHEHLEKRNCSPDDSVKFTVGRITDFGRTWKRFEETVDNLPDENCKNKFEHFFKVFRIVRIDEKKMSELGEEFSKLEDESYMNAAKEELLTSLKINGLNPDVLEPIKQRISKLKLMENNTTQIIPQSEIEFEPEAYSSLEQAMRIKRTILCLTENLFLSDVKMRLFAKNKGFEENQASLFVMDEILFRMTDDVVKAFSHRSTSLLVILWKNHVVVDTTRIKDVIKKLDNVMKENFVSKKNAIVIAEKNKCQSLAQLQFTKVDDDLTPKLRHDFLKSKIVFLQERALTLIELADDVVIKNLLGSTNIFEKLLTNQVKIGCELLKPTGHKENLFEFRLKQQANIDSNVFQENINDIFSYESNNFVWKSTIGSPLALLEYKILNKNAVYTTSNIQNILMNGPKTVLITGESGIGKSACLYEFAKQASKQSHINPVWLVQVILKKSLENITRESSFKNRDEAIHFLADYLELIDEQKEFFIMSAKGQLKLELMLFIDGYDEVPNKNSINSLLRKLQRSSVQKIFVASRAEKLQNILETFSYSLQFGDEERFQFMTKLGDGEAPKIDVISKDRLLNTPLHLTMFMELCEKKPEKSSIDSYFDLYEGYVKLHMPDNQLKNAYELSARKLLTENELHEIISEINHVDFELSEQLSRQTIFEYFAAMWLSEKTGFSSRKCVDNLVKRTSLVFLSVYLSACKLVINKPACINKFAEEGLLNFVKAATKLGVLEKPSLRRLLLNNKKNSYEIITFLLEHYNDTGCYEFIQRDKYPKSSLVNYVNEPVDGQTPLEAAAEANTPDLACELMLKGADISVLRKQHSKCIESMATYATTELANGNSRLGPIAAELLKILPQAAARLDNSTQLPKVLAYLFSHGHAGLIQELLSVRGINDRSQLLEAKVEGKSMLDHVNDSQLIKDDERHSMILYLVANSRSKLLQTNIDSILRSACLSGHENTFNYFIRSNANKEMSIPILQKALRSNDERVIDFLMRDTKRTIDSDGNNALHQAIDLEVSRKTVNYLLGKVGVNDRNNHGETALHLAFKRAANLSTIELLLSAGASLDFTDSLGIPPWVYVLQRRHAAPTQKETSRFCIAQQRELMRYLLQKHCLKFPASCTSGSHDFDLTKKEILPKLDYFANLDAYDLNYNDIGVSRLHQSLPNREEKDWCVFLINQGADVNIEKDGKSALHVALKYGCYEVAELMLEHGAVVDKMDVNKNTPLDYLTSKPNDSPCHRRMKEILHSAKKIFNDARELEAVMLVDSSNIDTSNFRYLLNCRDVRKRTLLHVAALTGKAAIIEKLHKLSSCWQIRHTDFVPINVNATDEDGNTPLHLAVGKNLNDSVEKLLSIGARFRVENSMGRRPMVLACPGSSVRKLLQAAEDLFKSVDQQNVRAILKEFPAVQYARDDSGKTPLYLAKDEETMKFLLSDVNVLDENQRSPIYYAAMENQLGRVKLLLKAGAIYDFEGLRDGNNESFELLRMIDEMFGDMHSHQPKFFVNDNPWVLDERLNVIAGKFGISRDVVVNVKDRQKNSLLHYAAKYDYVNVAENLLKNGAIFNSRNMHGKIPANFAFSSKQLFKSVEN